MLKGDDTCVCMNVIVQTKQVVTVTLAEEYGIVTSANCNKYILSQKEYDALTPVTRLQERNEALEVARKLIVTDDKCLEIHYCSDCPIGQIKDIGVRNHICIRQKHWPK